MEEIPKDVERFPEVERIIIEVLEDQGRKSNYSTLQALLPGVPIDKFLMSMCCLTKEGRIREGSTEEIGCFVRYDKVLVEGVGIAKTVYLVEGQPGID